VTSSFLVSLLRVCLNSGSLPRYKGVGWLPAPSKEVVLLLVDCGDDEEEDDDEKVGESSDLKAEKPTKG
jgi:hypothetical protein